MMLGVALLKPFAAIALLAASPLLAADRIDVGLTPQRNLIEALSSPGPAPDSSTVLLIGGLDGDATVARAVTEEVRRFDSTRPARRRHRLLAIPLANPANAQLAFPPAGAAYKENTESHALWRWIAMQAPDLVVVAGPDPGGLADALSREPVAGAGRIPVRRAEAGRALLRGLPRSIPPSEARREIESRLARSPRDTAELLATHYGHEFPAAVYIPAVALIGRMRLGQFDDVQRLAEPFLDGSRDSLAKASGSHLSGHLLFAELAERSGDARAKARVLAAANLGFNSSGEPAASMPLHNEMSDAVFMSGPLLAKAARLSGESRYADMLLRHVRFMQKLCLRADGLYRHSPLDEAAWGRGNAFPALGLALALSDLDPTHPAFAPLRLAFQNHMAALARHQQPDGMWRQVVDLTGAWPEFSSTAMIATAMLRGVRRGWLDPGSYQPRIDQAWRAIQRRVAADGRLLDVCESTGKQNSVDDYLRRIALFDRDPRGGAMALLLATELAGAPARQAQE
jgi:unsaturated rhamnogalacturonyl hydrolase